MLSKQPVYRDIAMRMSFAFLLKTNKSIFAGIDADGAADNLFLVFYDEYFCLFSSDKHAVHVRKKSLAGKYLRIRRNRLYVQHSWEIRISSTVCAFFYFWLRFWALSGSDGYVMGWNGLPLSRVLCRELRTRSQLTGKKSFFRKKR